MARMIGWRLSIQVLRTLATSERARSVAGRLFFLKVKPVLHRNRDSKAGSTATPCSASSEAFIGIDTAKLRNAVAIAEAGCAILAR